MPPKRKTKFVYPIDKKEDFAKVICEENSRLAVIDCHLGWCGPCEVIEQNYAALWFNIEDPENRIEFWSCEEKKMDEENLTNLQYGPLTCMPRFLLYRNGEKKAEISGADYTKLEEAIYKYLPQLEFE